jgi:hypothetical protein
VDIQPVSALLKPRGGRSSPAVGPGKSREEPAGGSSLVPSGRTKKQAICTIPNPQGPAAQINDGFCYPQASARRILENSSFGSFLFDKGEKNNEGLCFDVI